MTKKKTAAPTPAPSSTSMLTPGKGSRRVKTRLITIYGPAKTRKTGCLRNLPRGRTKWLVSDPNCLPTLRALDALPADADLHEVTNLHEARAFLAECLDVAEKHGAEGLGIDVLALDSITQFSDWHQQDVAKGTGQRWLGDNAKSNGWQQFNAELGAFLDDLAALARYITVIVVAHSAQKPDLAKSEWSGIALTPQMSLKLGRLSNWVLYKTLRRWEPTLEEAVASDDYVEVTEARGRQVATESILHTQPYYLWMASCNSPHVLAEEPADIVVLLTKDGLL